MSGRAIRNVVACLVLAALTGCGGADEPAAANSGPPVTNSAARRFVDAVNAGSTDQVLGTLTEDAVVIDSGRAFSDRNAIRGWLDAEVTGVDGRITVASEQATADGTVLIVAFRSSGFNGSDLRYTFKTQGDRVSALTLGG